MCNDVYTKNTKTGDSFKPDTEGYTKWGMVGFVHEHADGSARDVPAPGPKLTQQSFVRTHCKLPPDPIGGIGGAPVVVFIDGKTTPTTAFESVATYPCKLPAPPEDTICLIPKSTKARTVTP